MLISDDLLAIFVRLECLRQRQFKFVFLALSINVALQIHLCKLLVNSNAVKSGRGADEVRVGFLAEEKTFLDLVELDARDHEFAKAFD